MITLDGMNWEIHKKKMKETKVRWFVIGVFSALAAFIIGAFIGYLSM